MNRSLRYGILSFVILCASAAQAQKLLPKQESIAVQGRPYGDSIVLRWAPRSFDLWRLGNAEGYRVERYTLARNGKALDNPEKHLVNQAPLKPAPQADWINPVQTDKYAAIAAQALFGDSFDLDLGRSGVVQIVNKVRENEQRFSFALLCADMSPKVAQLSGLRYVDKKVRHNEKYLYRVVINGRDSLRGSLFVGTDDPYRLPPPNNIHADPGARTVTIRWDRSIEGIYSAYLLEKSNDGKRYSPVGSDPVVTLESESKASARYAYATDSLQDDVDYYYRVRGITAFGEHGDPSDSVKVHAQSAEIAVPQIVAGENVGNRFIDLRWEFDKKQEKNIEGFTIERTPSAHQEQVTILVTGLDVQTRSFRDQSPYQTNYYRVVALDKQGRRIPSSLYYAELVDSIPPSNPAGLSGRIDENGLVKLTWRANSEKDLEGYRVYRSNFESEEPFQVTAAPVKTPEFYDSVDLNTLDKAIYYRVMAVDINENHSGLSREVRLVLPDKTPPQPPQFLPITNSEGSVSLEWITGASDDVKSFHIYRKAKDSSDWLLVARLPNSSDSVHRWSDDDVPEGSGNFYTVTALDGSGNESEPAVPIAAIRLINHDLNPVEWKNVDLDKTERQVTLHWGSGSQQVIGFRLYRSIDGSPLVLFRTLPSESVEFVDQVIPGRGYEYRISAMLTRGRQTKLSQPITVKY